MEKNDMIPEKGKVRVVFHSSSDNEGPVKFSLNGRAGIIPREKEVVIDVNVLRGCFDNAFELKYPPNDNGGLMPPVKVQRYPYTVLGTVTEPSRQVKLNGNSETAGPVA